MKSLIVFLSLFCFIQYLTAQTHPLGGVEGAKVWALARKQGNDVGLEWRIQETLFFQKTGQLASINRHPALLLAGLSHSLEVQLPNELDLSQSSVFIVFQTSDTLADRALCYFEKNSETRVLISTQNLGNIASRSFFNTGKKSTTTPKILVFEQNMGHDTVPVVSQKLVIGQSPVLPQNSLSGFSGLFAELLIFDRVLSPEERQKVETSLALKYGISLEPQPLAAFVSPVGEVLHGSRKNQSFGWRIAGIGRDTTAGFAQKFAENQSESELISIEAYQFSSTEVPIYWLWGDNNATTRFAEQTPGQPEFIARKWKIIATGTSENLHSAVRLDTRRADADLPEGNIWWLALDHSGKGGFPVEETDFFPMKTMDGATAIFENVEWQSANTLLAFAAAPLFFVQFSMEKPQCEPPANGKLILRAVGGKAPYSFVLENKEKGFLKKWTTDATVFEVEDVQTGDFVLTASDAQGKVFSETFFLDNVDAPRAKLAEKYTLPADGSPLILDAAIGFAAEEMPRFYWYNEDEFESSFSKISIHNAGTFWLTLDLDGCLSRQKIEVMSAKPDVFRKVLLSPNPAPHGQFQLEIGLEKAAPINIDIMDASGRIVATRQTGGSDFYLLDFHLGVPAGDYQIVIVSVGSRRSIRLVVP